MRTYFLNGKMFLVHEDRLFVEAVAALPTEEAGRLERNSDDVPEAPTRKKYTRVAKKVKVKKARKGGRLSEEQIEAILIALREGESPQDIAKRYKISPGTVYYYKKSGGKEKRAEDDGRTAAPAAAEVPQLTDEEIKTRVADLQAEGKGSFAIAAELRVPLTKVKEAMEATEVQ